MDYVAYSLELEERLGLRAPLVRMNGKAGIDREWSTGPRRDPHGWRQRLAGWTGNVAVVCGDGLLVLDVDLYTDGAEDSFDRLRDLGLTIYTPTTITGGGGRHYWYRVDVPIAPKPLDGFPGIDVRGDGALAVIPPSVHPNGTAYEFEHGWGPFDCELASVPVDVLALLAPHAAGHESRVLDERDERAVNILLEHFGGHDPVTRVGYVEVTRPGKEGSGSATVGYVGPGVTRVWSTRWPNLPAGTYSLFELHNRAGVGPVFDIPEATHETFVKAARIQSRPQLWLWQDLVPAGQLCLAVGPEKIGKSTSALWIAARATKGELEGDYQGQGVGVVFISAEDDAERQLKPRALAAGADLEKLYFLDPEGGGFVFAALEQLDVKLAVFDPMSVYLKLSSTNEHGEMNIRTALDPFSVLAHRHDLSVLAIRHPRKSASSDNVFDVVLGSRAWSAAARAVLFFTGDAERPDRRGGLLFSRGNLSAQNPARRFRLDTAIVGLDVGGTTEVPLFVLEDEVVGMRLEDALGPRDRATAFEDAKQFLAEFLADGRQLADDVYAAAEKLEIKARTLQRAKGPAGARSYREGFGPGAVWWWELSIDRQEDA